MLKLNKIQLSNFLSHSDTVISFSNPCKVLIDGKSGSGKSSLVDALVWALYNKSRADGRSLIKHGEKTAKVTVFLSDGKGNEYKVERSITSKGKHTLTIASKPVGLISFDLIPTVGIKGQQEYLENELLKSSYLLFINSVIYPQDNVENFVKQTAAKRKEIILEIARASNYDEYYKKASDKITELNSRIMHNDDVVLMLGDSITVDKSLADKYDITKIAYQMLEKDLQTNKVFLDDLSEKINEAKINNVRKLDKETLLASTYKKLDGYKKELQLANEQLFKINSTSMDKKVENHAELEKLQADKLALYQWNIDLMKLSETKPYFTDNNDVRDIAEQIDEEMKNMVDVCPEIGRVCPTIANARSKKINELERQLKKASDDKNEYERKVIEYNKKVTDLGPQPVVAYHRIEELEKIVKLQLSQEVQSSAIKTIIANCEIQIAELNTSILPLKVEIQMIANQLGDIKELINKKDVLEKETFVFSNNFTELTVKLRETENAIKRLEINEKKLKEVVDDNREAKALLEAMICLKDAFSTSGIITIILDYVIPNLENKINEILSKLSDFRVRLYTQKMSISGKIAIEGLYIDIINERGESFDFDGYSGGEKMRIIFSIFLGLASFCKCDFKIFDEAVIGLDSDTVSNFIEILNSNIFKEINQVVMVSHIQEIKDCFEEKMEVIKVNGTSEILGNK